MIKKVATIAVYVNDQQAAKDFWVNKVGFEVAVERPMGPNGTWLEVAPNRAESHLVIYPKTMMEGSEIMRPFIVFQCDDVVQTYEQLKAKGVTFLGEPEHMPWGTFVKFADEDGNDFLLKQ